MADRVCIAYPLRITFPCTIVFRLVRLGDKEVDRFSFKEREEQFLRDGIVAVILFEDLQIRFPLRVAQDDRIGFEMGRRIGDTHIIHALLQIERHGIAHHGEVLIVDCQRRRRGRRREGCGGKDEAMKEAWFHRRMTKT